jgi:hypothetical protein
MGGSQDMAASGPSDRAVAIARGWLLVWGCVWLVIAGAFGLWVSGPNAYWGIAMAVVGLAHFAAARYASGRVAIFFAFFGP